MKTGKEVLESSQGARSSGQQQRQTEGGPRDEHKRRTALLYVRMTNLFPDTFEAKWGLTPEDSGAPWIATVARLTDEEIRRGLELCLHSWTSGFPPSPQEFRDMAYIPAAQRTLPPEMRITAKPADEATAKSHIERMREALR